jgi:4-carboxymuconolactone decarboxylase
VARLPEEFRGTMPRFLTEFGFGDFYARTGLDLAMRELLVLCLLATLGQAPQIRAHVIGNLRVGNSKERQVAALVHCFPYIGIPLALNAIRAVQDVPDDAGD